MKLGFTKKNIGKWSLLILLLMAGVGNSWGQATIAFQDFESGSDDWGFTANPVTYNVSGDVWANASSVAGSVNSASTGLNFWGMRDLNNPNGGGSFEHTLTFDVINTSSHVSVTISFDYITDGFDGSDELEYQIFQDGTGGGKVSLSKDTDAWTSVSENIADATNSAYIVIYGFQDGGGDYAGVDNFKIAGTATSTSLSTLTSKTASFGNISSLTNTLGIASLNFDFDYEEKDAGLSQISQIAFEQGTGNGIANWSEAILGAQLSDGTNSTTTATINANNITFAGIGNGSGELGEVLANATKTYSLRIWLRTDISTIIDGSDFVFEVNKGSIQFNAGDLANGESVSSPDNENVVEVVATDLQFSNVPTSVNVATDFGLSVSATDANGNVDTDNSSSTITLAKASGTGVFSSTTTLVKTLASGVASWTDLQNDAVGSFTISADDGAGLTDAVSSSITINNLPATIVIQDFEGTATDGWEVASGFSSSVENTGGTFTPSGESVRNGLRSFQSSNTTSTLEFASQNIASFNNVSVEIWNASISGTTGNGIDNGDFIKVYVSETSTFGVTPDIEIDGTSNARFGMSGTGEVSTTAETPIVFDYPSGGTLTGNDAKSKLTINIPDSWNMVFLRIETLNNSTSEIWCLDDISLIGSAVTVPGTSDVVAGGITEPAVISSLTTSTLPVDGYQTNFDFAVEDDGATFGTDALPTLINQVVVNQGTGNEITDWTTVFSAVNLVSGGETFAGTINTDNITFSSIPNGTGTALGFVGDDATKSYELKVVLQNPLPANTDNMNVAFVVDRNSFAVEASGSSGFETGAGTALESGSTNNEIQVIATALSVSGVPANILVDEDFSLTVSAVDARGNVDSDATPTVTATRNSGTGMLSSVSGLSQTLTAGTYMWTDLRYNTAETFDVDFTDNASTLTATNSGSINATELAKIAITEWLNNTNQSGTENNEWVELFNFGSTNVDILDWRIKDDGADDELITGSSLIIPPNGFVVLAKSKSTFEAEWLGGASAPNVLEVDVVLGNSDDEIIIEDASGNVVWEVAYNNDETEGRATHYTETTFSTRSWRDGGSAGIDRAGIDPASSSLGYESNTATPDFLSYASTAGDIGSPHGGKLPVIWASGAWSNGTGPTATDNVLINDGYTSASNGNGFTGRNLSISTGNTLIISDGDVVAVAEGFVNNGTIVVENNASFVQTAEVPGNSGSGTYIMNRVGTDFDKVYNYWSSPVIGETIGGALPSATARNRYSYDAFGTPANWVGVGDGTTMQAGIGYIATGKSTTLGTITRTFTSNLGFNSGRVELFLAFNDDGGGNSDIDNDWNLIGNPYPSGLSVADFLNDAANDDIDNALHFWVSSGNDFNGDESDYATMNEVGVTNGDNGGPTDNHVASGQSFFVRTVNNNFGNTNVVFKNSYRSSTNNTFVRTKTENWQRLWLNVTANDNYTNEVLVGFIDDANEGGGDDYDAVKFKGNKELALYFTSKSRELVIQGLPQLTESRTVSLGIDANEGGKYEFNINHVINLSENFDIFFVDKKLGVSTDLRHGNHIVQLEAGTYKDRFELEFIERVLSTEPSLELTGVNVFANKEGINLNFNTELIGKDFKVGIYDLSGKRILLEKINADYANIIPVQSYGILIVKIEGNEGVMTKKVYLEKQ